jgi:hypothetical protein
MEGREFSRASRCFPTLLNMTAVGRLLNFGQEKKKKGKGDDELI